MLKKRTTYSIIILSICNATLTLNALTSNFENTFNHAEQIATKITSGFKTEQLSIEKLKELTNDLVCELKKIPNHLEQSNGMLIIEREYPVTSGIIARKKEISKQTFFNDIDTIETLSKQATQLQQFQKIIELIKNILSDLNV